MMEGRLRGYLPLTRSGDWFMWQQTRKLYTVPPQVLNCQEELNKQTGKRAPPDQCLGPGD
ncbi:hypothetical protein SLEP1_g32301 [Rubroshorea leprosula]|uniref:Uncharacterized protein n=1 Tax=Rubroshorea leprosula TaxID=152421 RepID=A0AAV5KD36_9ROSI|nr:hypothetical protein SLEP1_g32301 [Rubroshorea leprosula]